MKKKILFSIPFILLSQLAYGESCVALSGCDKKVCELKAKLATVSEPHAVARIKLAISETEANCSDKVIEQKEEIKEDKHQTKIDEKVADAKEDIAKAEVKKAKAKAEGKMDKVMKYQHKIEEKELKIKHLKADM
jgi:hypothetical protein